MPKKTVEMLNNKVGDLVTAFSVHGKIKLVGSQQRRGLLYVSDTDILTQLQGNPKLLARYFKEVLLDIPKKSYFFMDFKCGLDKRLVYNFDEDDLEEYLKNPLIPTSYKKKIMEAKGEERVKLIRDLFILRWKPEDIIQGFIKLIDGTKYTMEEALLDDTILKLDIIIPVGDRFAEVSEMYIYKQNQSDNVVKSLADDINLYRHKNSMKSLKRLYSIIELENKEDKRLLKLQDFFNSEYGLLNKCANDLSILLLLTDKHTVDFAKIVSNLQMIKENLSLTSVASKKKILTLNEVTAKNYRIKVDELIEYLRSVINPRAKELLKSLE
jgi:hypothetical protein